MAWALVGSGGSVSTASGGSAVTPAWGTGESRTAGNTLICQVVGRAGTTYPTTPSGWQVLFQANDTTGTGSTSTFFGKIATGGDAAPTIAAQTGVTWYARLLEYSGGPSTLTGIVEHSASAHGITSPLTETAAAADAAVGNLILVGSLITHSPSAAATVSNSINNSPTNSFSNSGTSAVGNYAFAWGVTTTNASADSNTWTFTTTPVSGVTILASLTPTVSTTYNDSGTGTLTFSGSSSESASATDARAGTLTLAGASSESATYNQTAAGTLVLGGSSSEGHANTDARAGTLLIGGSGSAPAPQQQTGVADYAVRSTHGRPHLIDSTED